MRFIRSVTASMIGRPGGELGRAYSVISGVFGVRRVGNALQVFLERNAGEGPQILIGTSIAVVPSLQLRISADGPNYSFYYDSGEGWKPLRENDDGSILSTEVAGGFVGTVLGPFARQE